MWGEEQGQGMDRDRKGRGGLSSQCGAYRVGIAGVFSGPSLFPPGSNDMQLLVVSLGIWVWHLAGQAVVPSRKELELISVGGAIPKWPPEWGCAPRPGGPSAGPGSLSCWIIPQAETTAGQDPGALRSPPLLMSCHHCYAVGRICPGSLDVKM